MPKQPPAVPRPFLQSSEKQTRVLPGGAAAKYNRSNKGSSSHTAIPMTEWQEQHQPDGKWKRVQSDSNVEMDLCRGYGENVFSDHYHVDKNLSSTPVEMEEEKVQQLRNVSYTDAVPLFCHILFF